MSIAIKVENLSKAYQLGQIGTGTLSQDLERWWALSRGKEDPFLKVGEINDRTTLSESNVVWSLKDINLDISQGDAVGIIGKNGAGKSTFLKLLSRVTSPTTGIIKAKGRIASLLEVGTGFHPELTGKENIYLNGAILGMRKKEIDRKLDEIIDFSGVERYIDTPVKRYSSGMYVRLAFAVAAYLESEILIVDEVLAVGDVEFQKKCLGKMKDVRLNEGRTILFVSHNMTAISVLCQSVVILKNGLLSFVGKMEDGLSVYMKSVEKSYSQEDISKAIQIQDDEVLKFLDIRLSQKDSDGNQFVSNEKIRVIFKYLIKKEAIGLRIGFDLINKDADIVIFRTFHDDAFAEHTSLLPGIYISELFIESNLLKEGNYLINVATGIHNVRWITYDTLKINFSIINIKGLNSNYADNRPGIIMPFLEWNTNKSINQ